MKSANVAGAERAELSRIRISVEQKIQFLAADHIDE
jgi:hypothetical protein